MESSKLEDKVKDEPSRQPSKSSLAETVEADAYSAPPNQTGEDQQFAAFGPILGLQKLDSLTEEINNHYIASIIYQDLEKNLNERDSVINSFQEQHNSLKERLNTLIEEQKKIQSQVDRLAVKQQDCLAEYQQGAQELEDEVAEIDQKIAELQRRKAEIAEQQEVRLKEQDAMQLMLQSDIDQLHTQINERQEEVHDLTIEVDAMVAPDNLIKINNRIGDIIHHICAIFNVTPLEHPAQELATRHTSPGLILPPIFQLEPWAAEENKGLTPINIPLGAKQVILSLHMPGERSFERYSAELYASNGRRVWNSEELDINGRAIVITFNSTFFLSDDYEMRLRGRNSERNFFPIAEYYFHINKGK